ncbi:EXLDI protein [Nocardia bhagyanarayanae]|uniref:EXLDI family protein n=1 Tax=Nocardia bhagyanarayanae TaxID=1215925 RepID=A0A543F4R7_9NOCA|nr:EXLDI protein [Nocardia bhagyanarayanae]TQM28816.1 EXLDI family protein [Nocardia bhagyanarayanae]
MTNEQQSGDIPAEPAPIVADKSDDLEEIVLKAGPGGGRLQRFHGRRLAEARQITKDGAEVVRVYRSRKGKYVVQRQFTDWSDFAMFTDWSRDWKKWRTMFGLGEQSCGDFTVSVVDSVAEVRELVPDKVYRTITDIDQHGRLQDLDI